MSHNPNRGEVQVTLGGQTHIMRPTFEALVAIEERTGMSLLRIVEKASDRDISLGTIGAVVYEGIKATNPDLKLTFKEVGRLVVASGITNLIEPVVKLLSEAIVAGQEEAGGNAQGAVTK